MDKPQWRLTFKANHFIFATIPTQAPEALGFRALFIWAPMETKDLRATIGTICSLAALVLAIAAALKLFGFVTFRPAVIEMAAVAIALAHVR